MNKRGSRKLRAATFSGAITMLVLIAGCRSSAPVDPPVMTKVVRYSQSAAESFAEGDTDEAIEAFRKAIYRSWATDDPYHAGTNAYNLAAVLFYAGDHAEALDWLVDARVELARAGASAGDTYLLEAKIAQSEGRFHDASRMIAQADCTSPCGDDHDDGHCGRDSCESPLACLPCVGDKLQEKNAVQRCRADYQAQVHLARARLAAEQYDLSTASTQLAHACSLVDDACRDDLRAEIQDVAAMIDLAKGQYLQTAVHLDREALHLRQAGNYRKLPDVLRLAAAAYEKASRFDLAADRLCRAARIWFARGEFEKSWEILQQALVCSDSVPFRVTHTRLMLTAREIESALVDENIEGTESADQRVMNLQGPNGDALP